jgi:acetolactate synthase-1/2/3 large subunit
MGSTYGLALGAKVACPDRQVVNVIGDGSFMMILPEMLTAVENRIVTLSVIMHNDIYANVKYKQHTLYQSRYIGVDHPYPNFAEVARCFGVWGERVEEAQDLRPTLERALASGRPAVVDVIIDPADQIPPSDEYLRWISEHQMQVE